MIEDLEWRFNYHPPRDEKTANQHQYIRESCLDLAKVFSWIPPGREQSLALTKLEEAMFWANAAIARRKEED